MKLLLEVLTEFVSMFWADAGLCLGALAVVATVGAARYWGWFGGGIGDAESALALSLGCVLVLWLSVFTKART